MSGSGSDRVSHFVLGIDGGGTHTRAALVGLDGRVLGIGHGGPSNYDDVGIERAGQNIEQAVAAALQQANVARSDCRAAFLGMAGVTSETDRAHIRKIAHTLRLAPAEQIGIDHDCRVALAGGLAGRPGIVQILGTGSSCYGRNAAGESWLAGGRGQLISDEGSGYWLGLQAMRTAVMVHDGRLPFTPLHDRVLAFLHIASVEEILHRLHVVGLLRAEIAAMAPIVIDSAREGDAAAATILEQGAAEVAACVRAVAHKLGWAQAPFEVCLVGGLLEAGDLLIGRVRAAIARLAPAADVKVAGLPPVLGAALLALQLAGTPLTPALLQQLHQTSRQD